MSNTRAKVIKFPEEVARELDRLVGPGKRTSFVVEATVEKLERLRLRRALERTAGILKEDEYPEFRSSEDTVRWVNELRGREKTRAEEGWDA